MMVPRLISRFINATLSISLLLFCSQSYAAYDLNMHVGVTPISQSIYSLHMIIFGICCAIAFVVYSVLFYSLFAHRRSRGAKAASFHESTAVEVIWTIVPFIILIGMAVPATKVLMEMEDTSNADLTVKITGYQWKWHYDYLDDHVSFFSNLSTSADAIANKFPKGAHYLLEVDNPMVIPVGKKVRFLITSNDVQHAWWVPDLGVKKDAIPGFVNEFWARAEKPGTYRGQCAELCGARHGFMPIVVEVKAESEYEAWLLAHKQPQSASNS